MSVYVMIGASLVLFQEKLLFLPTQLERNYQFEFRHVFEELFLEPEAEVLINALHFKAQSSKGVILYFHGNAGDLSRWGKITEYFVDKHYDVLVMDYRTYGKSKGKLSEAGLLRDADYCYRYLLQAYEQEDIILYGRSLGTGMAAYLASKYEPSRIVLETPFFSIADVAKKRFPLFPVRSLLAYQFPNYKFLAQSKAPIVAIHGTQDKVIPLSSAIKLKEQNFSNMELITVEGAGHNNLINFDSYHETISRFLD